MEKKQKTWCIVHKGKLFSKHCSFWLAQTAVEKHLGHKLTNDYEIKPLTN